MITNIRLIYLAMLKTDMNGIVLEAYKSSRLMLLFCTVKVKALPSANASFFRTNLYRNNHKNLNLN